MEENRLIKLFEYNWQVRDEWLNWCETIPEEALFKKRVGGVHSIHYTLFHIIEVEYSWMRAIQEKQDVPIDYKDYPSIASLQSLSRECRDEIVSFFADNSNFGSNKQVRPAWEETSFSIQDILHHVIVHEVHHIGQLSIWAREVGIEPISASFIDRDMKKVSDYLE